MKITRAYIEGYVEGRFGNAENNPKCPHNTTASINAWEDGRERGIVIKHYSDETISPYSDIARQVIDLRRDCGEKI